MNKKLVAKMAVLGASLALIACGGKKDATAQNEVKDDVVLTVITNRTDLTPTVFPEYGKKFAEMNPRVKEVRFETSDDYENTVKTRMGTKDYGDVLLIPGGLTNGELPNFFAPLGSKEEVEKSYNGLTKIVDGQVYGIPSNLNIANIMLYNKQAFKKAGVENFPKNQTEFYEASKKLKENGITPYYTVYAAKWPFSQWDVGALGAAKDMSYKIQLINDARPFESGKPYYELYKFFYELAKNKWTEEDPITSDWDTAKSGLANGSIATLYLGSWAYPQIAPLASNKDDIGIAAFPLPAADGKNYILVSPDYNIGVNKNSENVDLSKEFVDFFLKESGYTKDYGVMSPVKGSANPAYVQDLMDSVGKDHIIYEEFNPRPTEEARIREIQQKTGIDFLDAADYKQEIIDAGLQGKSFDDVMNKLNDKWGKEVNKK